MPDKSGGESEDDLESDGDIAIDYDAIPDGCGCAEVWEWISARRCGYEEAADD
jgi:hypothetical protein